MPEARRSSPPQTLGRIVDLEPRIGAVGERVARQGAAAFADDLEDLARTAARGDLLAEDALLASVLWLLGPGARVVDELHGQAASAGLSVTAAMTADAPPHRALAPRGRLPESSLPLTTRLRPRLIAVARDDLDGLDLAFFRPLPPPRLPEWHVRRMVARLAAHHDPFVIRRLLAEPALRPRDVVRLAARRPTTPEMVRELIQSVRWMAHPGVRAALAGNPFVPTRTALLLAPTCPSRLRSLAAANVHPLVRALAVALRAP